MLACALVSRPHSKFISRQSIRRLLHTNGASFSRLTSSTIRICFCVFRTVPKHMLMQNWQKLHFTGQQLKAILPLEDLCIFLWWGYWNVNFGMVEAGATLPAQTRNCGAHRIKLRCSERKSSLEIFHVESEAAWNKNPRRAENFPYVPASLLNLVPTEREPSKRGLGGSYNLGNTKWRWATERWFQDTCFHGKHFGLLAQLEENNNNCFRRPFSRGLFKFADCKDDAWIGRLADGLSKPVENFHTENVLFCAPGLPLIFQLVGRVNWKHGLWMVVLIYTSQAEILEVIINFADSTLGQTRRCDSERHQDLRRKAILCVNFNLLQSRFA